MPAPQPLPKEPDKSEVEKMTGPSVVSEEMQRERMEQEEVRTSGGPLNSPRLELFSRPPPPPPLSPEPSPCRGWSLDDRRKGLELYNPCDSPGKRGREESESEWFMMSLTKKEGTMSDHRKMLR